jgi:hypothetical protein
MRIPHIRTGIGVAAMEIGLLGALLAAASAVAILSLAA